MATSNKEIFFRLDLGMEDYAPVLQAAEVRLANVRNFRPSRGRLFVDPSHGDYYITLNLAIRKFVELLNISGQTSTVFALTADTAYFLGFSSGAPSIVEVDAGGSGGGFSIDNLDTPAAVGWDESGAEKVYLTKLGTPLRAVTTGSITSVTDTYDAGSGAVALSAKYMAIVQNHLVLGNVKQGSDFAPRTVQWSDLYNPEDFEITSGKEADLFELELGSLEVTGLHSYRGYMLIFSRSSIWRAAYVGYPQIFRFEPFFSDFGNLYHYSSVNVRDTIFFIGEDNFYALNNFIPTPVGDPIWQWFKDNFNGDLTTEVRGYHDPERREVFWIFPRMGDTDPLYSDELSLSHNWMLVYNYKDNKWSHRNPDAMISHFYSRYGLRDNQVIDRFDETWTDGGAYTAPVAIDDVPWTTRTIDGTWQTSVIQNSQLAGLERTPFTDTDFKSVRLYLNGNYGGVVQQDGSKYFEFTTHEMYFRSPTEINEVELFKVLYKGESGTLSGVELRVGTRDNLSQDITWETYQLSQLTDNEFMFEIRKAAKYFTFRFLMQIGSEGYVEELVGGSVIVSGMQDEGVLN